MYCRGIRRKCMIILVRCIILVTYRVKSGFDVAECAVVCVSDCFREQNVKKYRKCLAVICYVPSVCTTLL